MRSLVFVVTLVALVGTAAATPTGEVLLVAEEGDGRGIAVADDGTRYAAGAVAAAAEDGGERRPVLLALDPRGPVRWRQTWDGAGQAIAVTVTPSGPVVLVAFRSTSFDADPGPEVAVVEDRDGRSAVAVALSHDGDVRWTWSTPRATLAAIVALPEGAVAIAGTSLDGKGFVAAIDADGGTTWQRTLARTPTMPLALAATDTALYVTGLGDATARRAGPSSGAFVARLEHAGRLAWLRRLGSRGSIVKAYAIAADEERVAIGGLFRGGPDLDAGPGRQVRVSVDPDDDAFVAAFTPSGEPTWIYSYGAASSDQVRGLALDAGQLYALGNQTEVVELGGAVGVQEPSTKWFLLALDDRGAPRASTPIVAGPTGSYPGLYVGALLVHHGRLHLAGDVSSTQTILGRTVAPVGARSPTFVELALPSSAMPNER